MGKITKHSFRILCTGLAHCEYPIAVAGDGGGDNRYRTSSLQVGCRYEQYTALLRRLSEDVILVE